MIIGIALLAVSMALFLFAMSWGLPRVFLRTEYAVTRPEGRGIRKCLFEGKPCVVYEAGIRQRRFVRQFLLYYHEGYKVLKCKLASGVRYIDYDVVVFDRYDKVLRVINVKEDVVLGQYTRMVELPDETAYVSLLLREVNDELLFQQSAVSISRRNVWLFAGAAFLLTLLESFVLKVSCAFAFGGVFRESFIRSPEGLAVGLVFSGLVGLLGLLVVMLTIRHKSKE